MKELRILFQERKINDPSFSDLEKKLFKKASEICRQAYAPYSNFFVGASLLLENNTFIVGNNQENSSFPCGICAERTALFMAKSNYPKIKVLKIAITSESVDFNSENPAAPCGLCRQVLLEYEVKQKTPIQIYIFNKQRVISFDAAKDLLPFYFTEERLQRKKTFD
tara:strand:+ start:80 stop:577 length:498 start_codon:yes stop_codon:yes gene_type:complete